MKSGRPEKFDQTEEDFQKLLEGTSGSRYVLAVYTEHGLTGQIQGSCLAS